MMRVGRVVGKERLVRCAAIGDRLSAHFSHGPAPLSPRMSSATIPDSWKSEFELPTNKEVGATSLAEELRADSPVID